VPAAQPSDPAPVERDLLGMTVVPLTAEIREALGLPEGATGLAVRAVEEGSEAATKGLQEGDVIAEAGQQPVATVTDLEDRLDEVREAGRKSLLLLVRRGGEPRFVALSVE
jgi:serine protease Do